MTNEQINKAIAEACGWKFEQTEEGGKITYPSGLACEFYPISWAEEKFLKTIPNYCGDLNAMHEAEKTIGDPQLWVECENNLIAWVECENNLIAIMEGIDWIWHATARQRAEAFLRTIGKWKEEEK